MDMEVLILSTNPLTEDMEDAKLMLYMILTKKKLNLPFCLIIYVFSIFEFHQALGTLAEGKGDTDTFFFTISCAVLLLCRDVVVLKQQHGIIHTPCKGCTLSLVYNCSKSPAQNGSFAFVTSDNTSLT